MVGTADSNREPSLFFVTTSRSMRIEKREENWDTFFSFSFLSSSRSEHNHKYRVSSFEEKKSGSLRRHPPHARSPRSTLFNPLRGFTFFPIESSATTSDASLLGLSKPSKTFFMKKGTGRNCWHQNARSCFSF